jgi:hypothetical protein
MATDKSSGVTGINWRISTLSTKTLIESRGAVDEKSATTRTGELTAPAAGETIFTPCARLMVAANKSTESVTLRTRFTDDKTTSTNCRFKVGFTLLISRTPCKIS